MGSWHYFYEFTKNEVTNALLSNIAQFYNLVSRVVQEPLSFPLFEFEWANHMLLARIKGQYLSAKLNTIC